MCLYICISGQLIPGTDREHTVRSVPLRTIAIDWSTLDDPRSIYLSYINTIYSFIPLNDETLSMRTNQSRTLQRRSVLKITGSLAVVSALAGCVGDDDDDAGGTDDNDADDYGDDADGNNDDGDDDDGNNDDGDDDGGYGGGYGGGY